MLTVALSCTVCGGTFHTREDWLAHLLQDEHQAKARKRILKWGKAKRDCTLVVYATFPVACMEVLKFFSGERNNSLVTDFIYFPSQPRNGFIQFKTKKKAKEVFARVEGPRVRINGYLVELKRGWTCLTLEWEDRLSSLSRDGLMLVQQDNNDAADTVCEGDEAAIDLEPRPKPRKKRSRTAPKGISKSIDESSSSQRPEAAGSNNESDHDYCEIIAPPKRQKKVVETICLEDEDCEVDPPSNRKKKSKSKSTHSPTLSQQLKKICKEMEIREDEFQAATVLKNRLQEALCESFPNCGLSMFRNWYLRLQSSGPGDLLLFLDYPEFLDEQNSTEATRRIRRHNVKIFSVGMDDFDAHFKDTNGVSEIELGQPVRLMETELGTSFYHKASGIHFSITNLPQYIPEVQTCRLLDYLLKFDSRATPLLTLIRFWAKINDIKLTKENASSYTGFPQNPAILDWLVILFLCEERILPTPRKVGERPHDKLIFKGVDIGFSADLEFAETFSSYQERSRDSHACNVLILAQQFFSFYSKEFSNGKLNIVLNTRDGELERELADFFDENCGLTKKKLRSYAMTLTMLNPLFVGHGFGICPEAFLTSALPAMEKTGEKLEKLLKTNSKNPGGKWLDLKCVLKLN